MGGGVGDMQGQLLSLLPDFEHLLFSFIFIRYRRNLGEEYKR